LLGRNKLLFLNFVFYIIVFISFISHTAAVEMKEKVSSDIEIKRKREECEVEEKEEEDS
jgi:hypothetical protein